VLIGPDGSKDKTIHPWLGSGMETHEIALQAETRQMSSIQTSYGSKHAHSEISTVLFHRSYSSLPVECIVFLHALPSLTF